MLSQTCETKTVIVPQACCVAELECILNAYFTRPATY